MAALITSPRICHRCEKGFESCFGVAQPAIFLSLGSHITLLVITMARYPLEEL